MSTQYSNNRYWLYIEYSNDMIDIYKIIEGYNLNKKQQKILIVFDDMVVDILSNKKT